MPQTHNYCLLIVNVVKFRYWLGLWNVEYGHAE